MNTFTKRAGIIGAGTAASAVLIVGLAVPANAATSDRTQSDRDTSSSETTTATSVDLLGDFRNEVPVVIGGLGTVDGGVADGGVLNGGVVNGPLVDDSLTSDVGDVLSGTSTDVGGMANGTDVGDIASGTEAANGNDVSTGDVSTGDVQAPVGSGNDTETDVSDLGGDISGTVDDLTGGDITGGDVTNDLTDTIDGTVSDLTDDLTGGLDLGAILR